MKNTEQEEIIEECKGLLTHVIHHPHSLKQTDKLLDTNIRLLIAIAEREAMETIYNLQKSKKS